MQYIVLENENLDNYYGNKLGLIAQVNNKIEAGWIPQGGIAMKQEKNWVSSANTGQHDVNVTYMQAMIKE